MVSVSLKNGAIRPESFDSSLGHTLVFSAFDASGTASAIALREGVDNLIGSVFNDMLIGNDGRNVMEGGDGDDTIDGGLGSDTVSYANAKSGVTVSLAIRTPQDTGGAGIDLLIGIENLIGSRFDDTLTGNAGNNRLEGGDGNDTVTYLPARRGVKVSLALQGVSQNTRGAGLDRLVGFENLVGSGFDDVLIGDGGDNIIEGGLGNDLLQGGLGVDTVSFARAERGVSVWLAQPRTQATLGAGNDTIQGFEHALGSAFADVLIGDYGANRLSGGDGDDWLDGMSGDDTLDGGSGSDTVDYSDLEEPIVLAAFGVVGKGSLGSDSLIGIETVIASVNPDDTIDLSAAGSPASGTVADLGSGQVRILGAAAPLPLVFSVAQFENVIGSPFADTLSGDAGTNSLSGGDGADTLTGGVGADRFGYTSIGQSSPTTADLITDFGGGDRIDLQAIDADPSTAADDAFSWVGLLADPSVPLAPGQVGYAVGTGFDGALLLFNGSGSPGMADGQVWLAGVSSVLSTDLLL